MGAVRHEFEATIAGADRGGTDVTVPLVVDDEPRAAGQTVARVGPTGGS